MAVNVTPPRSEAWTVITVGGEQDLFTAPRLREELITAIQPDGSHPQVMVDLTDVSFMDLVTAGLLVGAQHRITSSGGCMHLMAPSARVVKTMQVTGIHEVFNIQTSLAAALASGPDLE